MTEDNSLNDNSARKITIAYGDGVGPEIMEAALLIMREAGVSLFIEAIEIGQRVYNMGSPIGILPYGWEALAKNKVLLKAPTITPENTEKKEYKSCSAAIIEGFSLSLAQSAGEGMESWAAYTGVGMTMFEVAHPANPQMKGRNSANPTGMIRAAVAMLYHIGQGEKAKLIENALESTLAEGLHTPDIYQRKTSKQKLKTNEFAEEVVSRLFL